MGRRHLPTLVLLLLPMFALMALTGTLALLVLFTPALLMLGSALFQDNGGAPPDGSGDNGGEGGSGGGGPRPFGHGPGGPSGGLPLPDAQPGGWRRRERGDRPVHRHHRRRAVEPRPARRRVPV